MSKGGSRTWRHKSDVGLIALTGLIGLLAILALAASYVSHQDDVDRIARSSREAAYDNRQSQLKACITNNKSRQVIVQKYLLEASEQHQLVLIIPPSRARSKEIIGSYADRFNSAATALAQSVPAVSSQYPNSKDPLKRALVDCRRLYPFPKRRGDPMPKPPNPLSFWN